MSRFRIRCPGGSTPSRIACIVAMCLCGVLAAQTPASDATVQGELQAGEAALRAHDQAGAAVHFGNALKRDPGSAEAHANLGALAFGRGDCRTAEPDLRAALASVPNLPKVRALLAVCEHRSGEPHAVPDMQSAFDSLTDVKLQQQLGIELANAYYQAGDMEQTAAVLHTLLLHAPEDVDLLFFAQRVYSELADNTLNKLAVLSPGSARMEQLIAERLINAGDLKDAVRHYRQALALSPRLPGVHYELAEALLEDGSHDPAAQAEALQELKAAESMEGDNARLEVQYGRIAVAKGDTAQAMAHFTHAFALDPANTQAEVGLGDLYRGAGKPEEAARYLRMAAQGAPLEPSTHYKLSQLERQLGHEAESHKELQLFQELRAAQDRVKLLYQQMSPATAGARESDPPR